MLRVNIPDVDDCIREMTDVRQLDLSDNAEVVGAVETVDSIMNRLDAIREHLHSFLDTASKRRLRKAS